MARSPREWRSPHRWPWTTRGGPSSFPQAEGFQLWSAKSAVHSLSARPSPCLQANLASGQRAPSSTGRSSSSSGRKPAALCVTLLPAGRRSPVALLGRRRCRLLSLSPVFGVASLSSHGNPGADLGAVLAVHGGISLSDRSITAWSLRQLCGRSNRHVSCHRRGEEE